MRVFCKIFNTSILFISGKGEEYFVKYLTHRYYLFQVKVRVFCKIFNTSILFISGKGESIL